MKCELPELGRCCFCFPLRIGLLVWGYIKLIINLILFCVMVDNVIDDYALLRHKEYVTYFIVHLIVAILFLLDIIFHLIFAVSAHRKDNKKMEIFYRFSIFIFFVYVVGFVLSIAYMFSYDSNNPYASSVFFLIGMSAAVICFCCTIIQVYVIILIRSEVLKIQRYDNIEFVNQSTEAVNTKVDMSNPAA